jgi:hypothetical protein
MKALAILAFVLLLPAAFADSWGPPGVRGYSSPSGRYVLRVVPGDWKTEKTTIAVVYELSGDGLRYEKKREFTLLNAWSPVEACISDTAEVYTFDSWGRVGYGSVVIWYSAEGQKKKEYTLADLIPEKPRAEIVERHSSKSSIWWRRGMPYFNGPHLIIDDTAGGYVCLTQGTIDYSPAEKEKK